MAQWTYVNVPGAVNVRRASGAIYLLLYTCAIGQVVVARETRPARPHVEGACGKWVNVWSLFTCRPPVARHSRIYMLGRCQPILLSDTARHSPHHAGYPGVEERTLSRLWQNESKPFIGDDYNLSRNSSISSWTETTKRSRTLHLFRTSKGRNGALEVKVFQYTTRGEAYT
jgi:hypothetical protein